ncbi:DUF6264 family protein [Agromyces sp. C10]|uniref:DUF6264 family protein n=1 Tax=Agromyces sp. C10 TaxID=2935077 RepID=UPI00200B7787|nr:DUF6264 family protein [Agromyces sp. C10]MCK8609021.1 DUF6264 family protein [Agromyces sp. C10]
MSQDEAARNGAAHGAGAEGAPPPPPRDERPRPQYGEYAPEGWSWQPPAEQRTDAAASVAPAAPGPAAPDAAGGVRRGDAIATVILLVLGLFGAAYNALLLNLLPTVATETFRQTAEMLGTEVPGRDFVPGVQVPTLILVGTVLQLALWGIALAWSLRRLRARRLAFWVPLLMGALAFVVFYALMAQILLSDPEYARVLMGPGA